MIPIRTTFENVENKKEFSKDSFMNDFELELKNANVKLDYFGMQMIIKQEHMEGLIKTIQTYLFNMIGIKINNLNVKGYTNTDELPDYHSFRIRVQRCCGMDVKGFYNSIDQTVYVRIGAHLKSLLPILFHELTHAYIHQNNLKLVDDFPKPDVVCFDFASMMYIADQEEGICELVSSLMCYNIFDIDQYPSNVDEYWLGWRLSVQAFISFSEILINKFPNNDNIWVTKLAFQSILNHIKKTNNLYKFVQFVPKNEYHRTKSIFFN